MGRPVDDAHPAPPGDLLYAVSGEFRAGAQVRHGTIIASRDGCRQPPVRSSAHGRGSPARGPSWAPDRVLRPARAGRRRGGGDRARRRAQAEGAAEHRRRLRPRPPERLPGRAGQPEPVRAVRRPRGGPGVGRREPALQGRPPDRQRELPERGFGPARCARRLRPPGRHGRRARRWRGRSSASRPRRARPSRARPAAWPTATRSPRARPAWATPSRWTAARRSP